MRVSCAVKPECQSTYGDLIEKFIVSWLMALNEIPHYLENRATTLTFASVPKHGELER